MLYFNTVNELLAYVEAQPKDIHKKPKLNKAFKTAYIAFCVRTNTSIYALTPRMGIGKTTPYGWVKYYKKSTSKPAPVAESKTDKMLGKITKVTFGKRNSELGLHLTFGSKGFGVCKSEAFWDYSIKPDKNFKWSEGDRTVALTDLLKLVSKTLDDAKVDSVEKLINTPVELTFEDTILRSWRILTEVI